MIIRRLMQSNINEPSKLIGFVCRFFYVFFFFLYTRITHPSAISLCLWYRQIVVLRGEIR